MGFAYRIIEASRMSAGTDLTLLDYAQMMCHPMPNAMLAVLPSTQETTIFAKLRLKPESTDESCRKPRLPSREVICCLDHRDKS